jgi:MFS family permease
MRLFYHRLANSSFAMFAFPAAMVVLADNIMSYMFPIAVERSLSSNAELGAIMAFSSLIGISFDLFLSHRMRPGFWRFGFRIGVALSFGFPILTMLGSQLQSILLFLIASTVWGIYFEFIAFGTQDFIATTQPKSEFSRDWSMMYVIWALTAIVSPFIGSALLEADWWLTIAVVCGIQLLAFVVSGFSLIKIEPPRLSREKVDLKRLGKSLFALIELEGRVFPITVVTFSVQVLFSCFWTIGGLFGSQLSAYPWAFMTLYILGIILGNLAASRLEVRRYKKRIAMICLTIGGLVISLIAFVGSAGLIYLLSFVGGLALSLVMPMNESVYSDLSKRAPEWEMELISLSRLSTSLAYIVGPLLCGFLADRFGYATTFGIFGIVAAIFGLSLLLITPRKLKMRHAPSLSELH